MTHFDIRIFSWKFKSSRVFLRPIPVIPKKIRVFYGPKFSGEDYRRTPVPKTRRSAQASQENLLSSAQESLYFECAVNCNKMTTNGWQWSCTRSLLLSSKVVVPVSLVILTFVSRGRTSSVGLGGNRNKDTWHIIQKWMTEKIAECIPSRGDISWPTIILLKWCLLCCSHVQASASRGSWT